MKIRDFLWNYPEILQKISRLFAPFSYILATLVFISAVGFYLYTDNRYMKLIAKRDVTVINEGTIGYVFNLNPLFVPKTQPDRDLHALLFRKLIKISASDSPVADLATSWSSTADGKHYEFVLGQNNYWHDGQKITADDVVFTFKTAQDLASKFSQDVVGQGFEGLTITKKGDYRVVIDLKDSNATFWENASIYIVPEHIVKDIPQAKLMDDQYSKTPIGSGPFMIVRNDGDVVRLQRFDRLESSSPVMFYNYYIFSSAKNLEVAFRNGRLDIVSGVPTNLMKYISEYQDEYDFDQYTVANRKKIMFINTRLKSLSGASMRKALNYLMDKQSVISDAKIDGVPADSSFSPKSWAYDNSISYYKYDPKKAQTELKTLGYTKDQNTGFYKSDDGKILTLKLTYLNNAQNRVLAQAIKSQYEKEGIIIELVPQEFDQLTKETLATRDYQLILYEIEVSIDPDQYDLWHSLRVDFPFLNLSGYKYDRVDIFLEKGRTSTNRSDRLNDYRIVQKLLINDAPAVFLYEPQFVVVKNKSLKGVSLDNVIFPEDRYNSIDNWRFSNN